MASVFHSHGHQDEALRDQLESHLALLKSRKPPICDESASQAATSLNTFTVSARRAAC
jgi:hypothetical protein